MEAKKVLLVEGSSDKKRLQSLLAEPVQIVCTNGTVSSYRLEELLTPYEGCDLYIFVDADKSGEQIRRLIKRDFFEARHLYTDRVYREVATTPLKVLATILVGANFQIRAEFLF